MRKVAWIEGIGAKDREMEGIKIKIRIIFIVVFQHPEKGCYHTTMKEKHWLMINFVVLSPQIILIKDRKI